MRRILNIHGRFQSQGGAETYLDDLRKAQAAMGYEVFTIHADDQPDEYDPQKNEYFTGSSRGGIWVNFSGKHRIMNRIGAIIREFPAVYDIHWLCTLPLGTRNLSRFSPAGQKPCRACVEQKFALTSLKQLNLGSFLHYLARFWVMHELRSVEKILVHHESIKKVLAKNGFTRDKIHVLLPYLPVPDSWKRNRSITPSDHPDQDENGNNTVLFTGNISYEKGIFDLVRALSRIHDMDWHLLIVGEGEKKQELKRYIEEKNLQNRISFQGGIARENLADYYKRAAVIVMPSRCPETFGFAGVEAMFFGKPVVAYDTGIPCQWLEHSHTGYRVASGDIQELSYRIRELLKSDHLMEKFGKNSKKRVETFLDREAHMTTLAEIYRNIRA